MAEGDFNTGYFHSVTKARNVVNSIKFLKNEDGSRTSSSKEVHELAVSYFSSILTTIKCHFCPELPDFLSDLQPATCSDQMVSAMFSLVDAESIKAALFKMPLNRTPDPDGFNVEFIKAYWGIIGHELT